MEVNAQKIRAAMIDAKLNVRALSQKSGVSEPAINLMLNRKGRRARLDTVGKIAAALGVSGMELLKEA